MGSLVYYVFRRIKTGSIDINFVWLFAIRQKPARIPGDRRRYRPLHVAVSVWRAEMSEIVPGLNSVKRINLSSTRRKHHIRAGGQPCVHNGKIDLLFGRAANLKRRISILYRLSTWNISLAESAIYSTRTVCVLLYS